jgi:hypothetical protein
MKCLPTKHGNAIYVTKSATFVKKMIEEKPKLPNVHFATIYFIKIVNKKLQSQNKIPKYASIVNKNNNKILLQFLLVPLQYS